MSVQCPRCNSTQVHAGKRGWKLFSGFIGSSNVIITCLECGKQFRPGEKSALQGKLAGLAVLGVFLLIYLLVKFFGGL